MYRDVEYIFKTCIIGDPGVGKTSLIRRFLYPHEPVEDLGARSLGPHLRKIVITCSKNHRHQVGLQLWDLFNTPRPSLIRKSFLWGAFGIIGLFDVTRPTTMTNLLQWMEKAHQLCERTPVMMVVGNKVDLREVLEDGNGDGLVDFETGRNFSVQVASKLSLNFVPYQEITVLRDKDAEVVTEVFRMLGWEILNQVGRC